MIHLNFTKINIKSDINILYITINKYLLSIYKVKNLLFVIILIKNPIYTSVYLLNLIHQQFYNNHITPLLLILTQKSSIDKMQVCHNPENDSAVKINLIDIMSPKKSKNNSTSNNQNKFSIESIIKTTIQNAQSLISVNTLKQFIDQRKRFFYSYKNIKQYNYLVTQYMDILSMDKNHFKESQIQQMVLKLQKIAGNYLMLINQVQFEHQNSFKIYQKLSNGFQEMYMNLKFDLTDQKQIKFIASKVFQLCKLDMQCFTFLSNYFVKSVQNYMQKHKYGINQAQKLLKKNIFMLEQIYVIAPSSKNIESLDKNKNKTTQQQIPQYKTKSNYLQKIKKFILKQINEQSLFEKQLNAFIMQYAQKAKYNENILRNIVSDICYDNKGKKLKINLKVQDIHQKSSIQRVRQKLLSKIKIKKQKQIKDNSFQQNIYDYSNSKQVVKQNKQNSSKKMRQTLNQYSKKQNYLYFTISDMLRGKCMFKTTDQIKSALESIIKKCQKQGHQIIQIQNRLQKNKDVVIKILLKQKESQRKQNGVATVAEFQLVLEFDSITNQYNHKLYQLKRSKAQNLIHFLFQFNQKKKYSYLKDYLMAMFNKMKTNYDLDEVLTLKRNFSFHQSQKKIKYLMNFIDEQIIKQNSHQIFNKQDYLRQFVIQTMINNQLSNSKKIKNQKHIYQFYQRMIEGIFYQKIHNYQKSYEAYKLAQKEENNKQINIISRLIMKKKFANLILKNKKSQNLDQALNKYLKCLQLDKQNSQTRTIKTASIYNDIGIIYEIKKQYNTSYTYHRQGFEIIAQISKKDRQNGKYFVFFLHNMGSVLQKQSKYQKALQNYKQCLKIKQQLKGKDDISCAVTCINIGNIYLQLNQQHQKQKENNIKQAIRHFQRTLDIFTRFKGKHSIQCAQTHQQIGFAKLSLGLFYESKGNYEDKQTNLNQAIQQYTYSENIHKQINKFPQEYFQIIRSIAHVHKRLKNPSNLYSARSYYKKLINLVKEEGQKYLNIKNQSQQKNQKQSAISQFNEKIADIEQILEQYHKQNNQTFQNQKIYKQNIQNMEMSYNVHMKPQIYRPDFFNICNSINKTKNDQFRQKQLKQLQIITRFCLQRQQDFIQIQDTSKDSAAQVIISNSLLQDVVLNILTNNDQDKQRNYKGLMNFVESLSKNKSIQNIQNKNGISSTFQNDNDNHQQINLYQQGQIPITENDIYSMNHSFQATLQQLKQTVSKMGILHIKTFQQKKKKKTQQTQSTLSQSQQIKMMKQQIHEFKIKEIIWKKQKQQFQRVLQKKQQEIKFLKLKNNKQTKTKQIVQSQKQIQLNNILKNDHFLNNEQQSTIIHSPLFKMKRVQTSTGDNIKK